MLLAPWGALAFAAYLIRHTGSLLSYSRTEKDGWGTAFDGGTSTFSQAFRAVLHPGVRPPDLAVVAFIVVALVLLALLLRDGVPAPVLGASALLVGASAVVITASEVIIP